MDGDCIGIVYRVKYFYHSTIVKIRKVIEAFKNPLLFKALLNGVGAGIEHKSLLSNLDCRYIADIGANRGQFALIARCCFPDAKIVSFEPLERPTTIYKNIFQSEDGVVLYNSAIGPVNCKKEINITAADDSSSLLEITPKQQELFPGCDQVGTSQIDVRTLDEFISREEIVTPALIKIDVQGYELEVLKGCGSLIDKFKWVYCECSLIELYRNQSLAGDVIKWLDLKGFYLRSIHNMEYDNSGISVQADFLFEKNGSN